MLNQQAVREWMQTEAMLLPKERILAGFSGGSDSAALCHILAELRRELDFFLELIYVQHNLRAEESKQEEQFVMEWAEKYNCPLTIVPVNVSAKAKADKISIETAARQLRHDAFRQRAVAGKFTKIALAHHAKDQAETVLMHFLRGSGVKGLAGMKKKNGLYLRPLLNYTKPEIEQYLYQNRIKWCEDSSNLDLSYRRNRIRLELLPYLQNYFNPNIVKGLTQTAEQMQELEDYLLPQIELAFKNTVSIKGQSHLNGSKSGDHSEERIALQVERLRQLPVYLQQMVIRRALAAIKGDHVNLEYSHVKRAISLLDKSHGKREDLVNGWQVRKSYENLIFEKKSLNDQKSLKNKEDSGDSEFAFGLDRITGNRYIKVIKDFILIGEIVQENRTEKNQQNWSAAFDFDCLPINLTFRYAQPHDYIRFNALGNKKRLKDFLTDQKVPKEERSRILVIAAEQEVIWVVGHRIGYPYRVTANTQKILKLSILTSSHCES